MKYSILLVDDDDDDLLLLACYINRCHQQVSFTCAKSGLEATTLLQSGLEPNLILVDINTPLMNGYELLVWIMQADQWRHIPVVIWAGELSDSAIHQFYRAGANSVMLKQDTMKDIESFCHHWFKLVQLPLVERAGV